MNKRDQDEDKVVATDDKEKPVTEKHEIECVFIVENGKAKITPVKTGIQDNAYFQILSGLKEGDEVIALPYALVSRTLKNGDLVNKVDKSKVYNTFKK